jgi:regulator of sirC expression with transglutaminase-like and TPR domain
MSDTERILERFRELVEREPIDLFEAALEVALLIDSDDDADQARKRIEALGLRIRERRQQGVGPLAALTEVLFDHEGFHGDDATYDLPRSSSVIFGLRERRGLPITLSVLTIEAGRRAGIDLAGIGLPGHFVVGGGDLRPGIFLDPYDGGVLRDTEEQGRRLAAIFGQPVEITSAMTVPLPAAAILARMLANLRGAWTRQERFEDALATTDFARLLPIRLPDLERERGLLFLRLGRADEAVRSFKTYLASDPEGPEAEAVNQLIEAIRSGALLGAGSALLEIRPRSARTFTLEQARALLPRIREVTAGAVMELEQLPEEDASDPEIARAREQVVGKWVRGISALGGQAKGLWLVDFDSGAGYYCWRYPEERLEYFHSYEEGFAGRLKLQ